MSKTGHRTRIKGPIGAPHSCDDLYVDGHDCPARLFGHAADHLADDDIVEAFALLAHGISTDDLAAALSLMPRDYRSSVLSHFNVPPVRKVGSASLEQLHRRATTGAHQPRCLIERIAPPVYMALTNLDMLGEDELVAALDPTLEPNRDSFPFLLSALGSRQLPPTVVRAALAGTLLDDSVLSPLAIGWLAEDPGPLPDQLVARLAAAWAAVRSDHPSLPPSLRPLYDLVHKDHNDAPVARTAAPEPAAEAATAPPEGRAEVTELPDVTTPVAPERVEAAPSLPDALGDMLAAVEGAVDGIADRLSVLAAQLDDGVYPDSIADDAAALTALAVELAGVRGTGVVLRTSADIASLRARLSEGSERARRLARAARIEGPEKVEDLLAEVRTNAHDLAEHADAVLALVDLVDHVAARPQDSDGLDDRHAAFVGARPAHWDPLTLYAVTGRLSLPDGSQEPVIAAAEDGSGELDDRSASGSAGDEPGTAQPEAAPAPALDAILDDLASWAAAPNPSPVGEAQAPTQPKPEPEPTVEPEPEPEPETPAPSRAETPGETTPADSQPRDGTAATGAEQAPTPAATDDGTTTTPAEAAAGDDALAARMMDEGRVGLAAWLADATGDPALATARRMAALAGQVRSLTGRCAGAVATLASTLDLDDLPDDPRTRLLLAAAAARAGIVAPGPSTTAALTTVAPALAPTYPRTAAMLSAYAQAAATGVLILPVADTARAANEAATSRAESSAAARRLLVEGPSRTVRYQLATAVWTTWIRPDGLLGRAVSVAADDDDDRIDIVDEVLDKLGDDHRIDREVDLAATALRRSSSRSEAIISRAREKLLALIAEALDILRQWRDDVRECEVVEQASPRSWQAGPLAELRKAVAEHTDASAAETDGDGDVAEAARLIAQAGAILAGTAVEGDEPDPDRILNGELLAIPELPLESTRLAPVRAATLDEVASAAQCPPDPLTWYERRAAVDDHQATAVLLTIIRETDPDTAARLAASREQAVAGAVARRETEHARLSSEIDSALRHGLLDDAEWGVLTARLAALAAPGRLDFSTVAAGHAALASALDVGRDRARDRARARLEDKAAADQRVAAIRDRLAERIADDDLTAFEEYLALATTGQDLPAPRSTTDHLARFFPSFPRTVLAARTGRSRSSVEIIRALESALAAPATAHGSDALSELLTSAGIALAALPEARRVNAASALAKWRGLSQGPKSGQPETALHAVLALAGLSFTSVEALAEGRARDRQMFELRGVSGSGRAMLPAFGSAMSPTGDTLRVAMVWGAPDPVTLVDGYSGQPTDRTLLTLYFGTLGVDERRMLATAARRRRRPPVVVFDDASLMYLACQDTHTREAAIAVLAPFSGVAPFTPLMAGDVPREMFYGRTEELASVIDPHGSCFVSGGRQLGKSALLRAAARRFDDGSTRRAAVASIFSIGRSAETDRLWPTLWAQLADMGVLDGVCPLDDPAQAFRDAVATWLAADPHRQLLLLLDEADAFLDEDSRDGHFPCVHLFRQMMEESGRRVKIVFAGLHQTARFEQLGNQPLAHFGSPVSVGPLNAQAAYDLLTEPMRTLGYRFADESVPSRVLALANNSPALIQLFGAALLERLMKVPMPVDGPPVTVTSDDIEQVWADQELMDDFRSRFEWTLNLDPRYKVIAYRIAYGALADGPDTTIRSADLRAFCSELWPTGFATCTTDEFRGLLGECVELGVLTKVGDGYRLRSPNVLRLLGTLDEVEAVLLEAQNYPAPAVFDAAAYRPPFAGSVRRSPLSDAQSREILARRDQIHVVSGSAALRLERVPKALEEAAAQTGHVTVHHDGRNGKLAALAARAAAGDGHHVLVVDLARTGTADADAVVAEAVSVLADPHRGTLSVVLLADPVHAPLWLAAGRGDSPASLVELGRLDATAVRLWMAEAPLPFQNGTSQAGLVAATGGWPLLLDRVVEPISEGLASPDAELATLSSRLDDAQYAGDVLTAAGLTGDGPLAQAWKALVELDEPASAVELAALLETYDELTPSRLAGAGYRSVSDVVEALRIAGALAVDATARLSCEPVLARVTRTAS